MARAQTHTPQIRITRSSEAEFRRHRHIARLPSTFRDRFIISCTICILAVLILLLDYHSPLDGSFEPPCYSIAQYVVDSGVSPGAQI